MYDNLLPAYPQRVSGVVSPLKSYDHVGPAGQ
jgi:hypothetical protein